MSYVCVDSEIVSSTSRRERKRSQVQHVAVLIFASTAIDHASLRGMVVGVHVHGAGFSLQQGHLHHAHISALCLAVEILHLYNEEHGNCVHDATSFLVGQSPWRPGEACGEKVSYFRSLSDPEERTGDVAISERSASVRFREGLKRKERAHGVYLAPYLLLFARTPSFRCHVGNGNVIGADTVSQYEFWFDDVLPS